MLSTRSKIEELEGNARDRYPIPPWDGLLSLWPLVARNGSYRVAAGLCMNLDQM